MAIIPLEEKKLFLLPFPQHVFINEAGDSKLICNVVVLPRNNPFDNLVDGDDSTSLAGASFTLKAWLVKGDSDQLPLVRDHVADANYVAKHNLVSQSDNRQNVFHAIETKFTIAEPDPSARLSGKRFVSLKKYLPEAYREAFGFSKPRNSNGVTDESYFCSLKTNSFAAPFVKDDTVNWSQVLAFALSQPLLAKALGILYTDIEVPVDSADFFKEGGWVYFDFDEEADATATIHLTNSDLVQYYAARIPAVTQSRQVFAPVLFPVLQSDAGGNTEATVSFDDVFKDVVQYDDGFAKIVHCSQAVNTNPILEAKEGPSPLMDTGIRLGWDDEQILAWLNRGFAETHTFPAVQKAHSKFAVSRYRIDVADISKEAFGSDDISLTENEANGNWKSQVALTSRMRLSLDGIELGDYTGESGVQVAPAKNNDNGIWLPAFFAFWNGASLAVPDPIPEIINKLAEYKNKVDPKVGNVDGNPKDDKEAAGLYRQLPGTKASLRYGHHYAFRVRFSDISGGGPVVTDTALSPGDNRICKHRFTRNVAPSPPVVSDVAGGLSIFRPRLGYPAILFAADDADRAVDLLIEDRQALDALSATLIDKDTGKYIDNGPATYDLFKQASREVSIADPDVDKVQIIVEVSTLDMDREGSYNASQGITPKEPYVLLYKTVRSFNQYALSLDEADHTLTLPFEFRDVPVLFFNEGKDANALGMGHGVIEENGSLVLPSARKIRLTIRSFCSQDKTDYFGDDDFRFSTPVKRDVMAGIDSLEDALLLQPASDPLVSIFFRPEATKTPQERRAAAGMGEHNAVDIDIVERLAAVCSFDKNGLSVLGKINERIQFGCSHQIGHTLSPDHTSLTFATADDLSRKWISVIRLELNRDWCWDMLAPDSFDVFRQWKYSRRDKVHFKENEEEKIGTIGLTKGINWQNIPEPDRSKTKLVFIDAFDNKPGAIPVGAEQEPSLFPEPVTLRYRVVPRFNKAIGFDTAGYDYATQPYDLENTLPITLPPSQVPEIVSVGLAVSASDTDEQLFANQYSETSEQVKYLWVEFAEPVENPDDTYFARLLAYAPDPVIADYEVDVQKDMEEPALNIDAENIRLIRPKQVHDKAGVDAMQMLPASIAEVSGEGKGIRHFLLPLPQGLNADSPELFGFFTYEFRVGHTDEKWSTAQGRYGRPLPITGIQHPAPKLRISAMRQPDKIEVSAAYAESYFKGGNCTPLLPRTTIYILLYAQVLQADGKQYRNILVDQIRLPKPSRHTNADKPVSTVSCLLKDVRTKLLRKGIDMNAPLSVLAIELMPDSMQGDPAVADIPANSFVNPETIRLLRTSRLYKVADSCPV